MKNLLRNICLFLAVGVVGLVTCELTLRLGFGDRPTQEYALTKIPGLLYVNYPNHHWTGTFDNRILKKEKQPGGMNKITFEKRTVSYSTNRWGFRGPDDFNLDSLRDKTVILCAGDSTTWGMNVNDTETYSWQLQQLLRARGIKEAVVVNAGVPGYNLWDYKATVAYWLPRLKPRVVVVGIFMNDSVPWTWMDRVRAHLSRHSYYFFNLFKLVLLIQEHWPKDISRQWTSVFTETLDRDSQLAALRYARMKSFPQCVADYVRDMNHLDEWNVALGNAAEMKSLCDRHGARLICLIIPCEFQVMFGYKHPEPQATIARYLVAHGIESCDVRPLFIAAYRKKHTLYSISELVHFNGEGHRFIAEWLDRALAHPASGFGNRTGNQTD